MDLIRASALFVCVGLKVSLIAFDKSWQFFEKGNNNVFSMYAIGQNNNSF